MRLLNYHRDVYQLRLFGLLLRPSTFSALAVTGVAFFVLGISNWSAITHNALFYDYFFGRYGVTTALQHTNFTIIDPSIFAQTYTYDIVVVLVAALSGILVYIVLESLGHGIAGARAAIDDLEVSRGKSRMSVEIELGIRWGIRISAIVLWTLYAILFANIIVPFCILTTRVGAGSLDMWLGWLYSLLGFGILWIGLYMHVICARLSLLRPRVFGGKHVMEAEIYE